ncbi:MAG: hypothetical protein HC869_10940 [Rhodospirillales bacterium]|nr:hypothetical protein [Rhodospirillales bacterium]
MPATTLMFDLDALMVGIGGNDRCQTTADRLDRFVVGAPADGVADPQLLFLGIEDLHMQAVRTKCGRPHFVR